MTTTLQLFSDRGRLLAAGTAMWDPASGKLIQPSRLRGYVAANFAAAKNIPVLQQYQCQPVFPCPASQRRQRHTARCQAASTSPSLFEPVWSLLHTHPWQDLSATLVAIAGGLALVKTFDSLSHRDIINKVTVQRVLFCRHMQAAFGPSASKCS